MNTHDYDRIIELYLDGALSPVEEHEFRALVALEPDLRRLLDAELAVRRAFNDDAEAIPEGSDRPYARFLAALAVPAGANSTDGSRAAPLAGAPRAGWLPPGIAKYAGALLVAAGLAVGAYVVIDRDNSGTDRTARPSVSRQDADDLNVRRDAGARESHDIAAQPRASAAAGSTRTSSGPARSLDARSQAGSRAGTSQMSAAKKAETRRAHEDAEQPAAENNLEQTDDLPLIENDSVSARINLKLGR